MTQNAIAIFKQQIMVKYECKDLGALDSFINMEVVRTKKGELRLYQTIYTQDVLCRSKTQIPGLRLYIKI